MPDGFGRTTADPFVAVRWWLYGVAALVFALIVVGGATRLTDSGLSITEWRPIMGILPPLSEADWRDALEKYRQIPEYKLVNRGMSLDAFKFIFWWEWTHRFLARMVGFAFAIPFVYFAIRRRIPATLTWKLAGLFALGGMQGAIGWYMVSSGLVDRIDVSHVRLALHLTVAFLILALLLWAAWSLLPPRVDQRTAAPGLRRGAQLLLALIFLQVVLGALVAGLKAGLTHNTWPLMDGQLVPSGLWAISPWYLNPFENVTAVQFNHRMVAYLIVAVVLWHAVAIVRSAGDSGIMRWSVVMLTVGIVAQATLGIVTLLAHVPLSLGLAHQGLAAVVTGLAVWHLFVVSQAREPVQG